MTLQLILSDLWAAGICLRLTKDGQNLSAPAGCLSQEQRALVLTHKPALVVFLQEVQATTKDLIKSAMQVCDQHGDNESARADMQRACLETPLHLQADLHEHLRIVAQTTYKLKGKIHE
jgi:TubC N-terminal docking domain